MAMKIFESPYDIDSAIEYYHNGNDFILGDNLLGFDVNLDNPLLNQLNYHAETTCKKITVHFTQIYDDTIKNKYPNLIIKFDFVDSIHNNLWVPFKNYKVHPEITFKNFICSFNGSPHVSRKLLVSILKKFRWFDPMYCSKNFSYSVDVLDGHLLDYTDLGNYYRKFFIENNSETFFQTKYSFGHHRYAHSKNIYNLEDKLTESFLHVVSETMATSYYPFVTEKFLYSVVTRGLFLAYAQPGWHAHLENYYGFKPYTRLFNYHFDSIQNPVDRLIELMSMISKFSVLSTDDWRDLYEIEKDIIEYNYDRYFSGDYLKSLEKFI